jgi:hypothetical protein
MEKDRDGALHLLSTSTLVLARLGFRVSRDAQVPAARRIIYTARIRLVQITQRAL